jgi:uncharacterized protein YdcH (DUF465 family)
VPPPQTSKELRELFSQMKVNTDARKEIYDKMEALNKVITNAEAKRDKAEKKVHPKYNKLDLLDKGVK